MRLPRVVYCLGMLAILAGCGGASGPELHPVSGTVTIGGKPAPGISVTFSADSGPSSAGRTDEAGKYTLATATGQAGAVAGQYKVVLSGGGEAATSGTFDPKKMEAERSGQMGKARRGGSPQPKEEKPTFPPEYGDPNKTPAKHEVKAGSNTIDIVVP